MIVIFVAFLALVSGGSLLMKDREFSPNENRYLAEPPRLTVDNILSGKFQDGLENYLRDQICFRDGWITVKTGIQKACKDTDIGGAYVGKDGYDFEKITPEDVDEKQIARNVKAVQDFFAKASENVEKDRLSFLLVPSSGLVMEDKLPAHARLFDQAKYIDQIEKQMTDCRVTDVRKDLLSHKDDYIYYKTDHHWTSEGAYSLSKDIGVSVKEADAFLKNYLATFPKVSGYMDKTISDARNCGYVSTLFGRRRSLPELASNNHNIRASGERMARNTPIQGTAADVIKLAMVRVWRRLRDEKMESRLILTVHDELIVEAPEAEAAKAAAILQEEMEGCVNYAVPLSTEVHQGKNWLEAH